jgi:hypothetical protein
MEKCFLAHRVKFGCDVALHGLTGAITKFLTQQKLRRCIAQ